MLEDYVREHVYKGYLELMVDDSKDVLKKCKGLYITPIKNGANNMNF